MPVLVLSAVWVGQEVRTFRAGALSTPAAETAGEAGAAGSAIRPLRDAALRGAGGHSYVNDPDQLVWVVVVIGEIDASARVLGPIGYSPPPVTYAWELHVVDAVTGQPIAYSCCGPDPRPPAWFDALADLAQ